MKIKMYCVIFRSGFIYAHLETISAVGNPFFRLCRFKDFIFENPIANSDIPYIVMSTILANYVTDSQCSKLYS